MPSALTGGSRGAMRSRYARAFAYSAAVKHQYSNAVLIEVSSFSAFPRRAFALEAAKAKQRELGAF